MNERDLFDRSLESLHKATLDDGHWATAFRLIDEACGTKGNCLVHGRGYSSDEIRIFLARFLCRGQRYRDMERKYFDGYHGCDERMPRLRRLPDSQLVHVRDLFNDKELKTSTVYNEILCRSRTQDSLNVRLDGPNGSRIVWVLSGPADGDGWSFARTEMARRLLPHIRHYVTIRHAIAEAGALGASLTGLLQHGGIGIIQLDRRGRIVAATDRAAGLLAKGGCLFDRDGFLYARYPHDNAVLQQLLARALPAIGAQGVSGSMAVRGTGVVPGLEVRVSPVGRDDTNFGARRIAALVLVAEPAGMTQVDPAVLKTTLDLTPTESRVAALLAGGKTVRDIAVTLARSENTIRWHLRQIYAKHGISREVELVLLVLSVSGPSGNVQRQ